MDDSKVSTVDDLYNARHFNSAAYESLAVKKVDAIHRKRRVHVPKVIELVFKVAYSPAIEASVKLQEDGVFAVKPIDHHSMIKLPDTYLRMKMNDLAMDLSCLLSYEARNSARGFIDCCRKAMQQYFDVTRSEPLWNVAEGYDKETNASNVNDRCIIVTTKKISAGEELSICYGLYYWLKECIRLVVTDRNLFGFWFVLKRHIDHDKFMATSKDRLKEFVGIAARCERLIQESCPSFAVVVVEENGQTLVQESLLQVSLTQLEQYDALFAQSKEPAVSMYADIAPSALYF